MEITALELNIGSTKIELSEDSKGPRCKIKRKAFRSIAELLEASPELKSGDYAYELACCLNHLTSGFEYEVIKEPLDYQRFYKRRVWQEKASTDRIYPRLTDFGIFDTTNMEKAKWHSGALTFYVQQRNSFLPFKVTLKEGSCNYEQLPLSSTV